MILPEGIYVENKLRMLKNVDNKLQFTLENKVRGCIPFLDVIIKRINQGLSFSVSRIFTNNDFIYSFHTVTGPNPV